MSKDLKKPEIHIKKIQDYPGCDNRFRFRVWDTEEKKYVSLSWHARLHNSFLEVGDWQIIEQCTGRTDKNGKLIFEGDVIADGFIKAIVTWDGDCYLLEYDDGGYGVGELAIWGETFEIIGNIHEIEVEK